MSSNNGCETHTRGRFPGLMVRSKAFDTIKSDKADQNILFEQVLLNALYPLLSDVICVKAFPPRQPQPGMRGATAPTSPHCARCRSAWSISTRASMASQIGGARRPTQGSWRPVVTI